MSSTCAIRLRLTPVTSPGEGSVIMEQQGYPLYTRSSMFGFGKQIPTELCYYAALLANIET
jgi:hypothetical protein